MPSLSRMVDSAVAVFSPARAARRAHARGIYERIVQRGYDAAKQDRLTAGWQTNNLSADRELYADADRTRARARDLIRNNAYARGALDAIVANVVGCGIMPQPRLDDDDQNRAVLDSWNRWCERADAAGRLHFCEQQALLLRETIEAGECLGHFVSLPEDLLEPRNRLAIELVEADRLATDRGHVRIRPTNENDIRRGVEVDSYGRPVAYWVYPQHPNDVTGQWSEPKRIPARDILHVYRQERIGQSRGVSWLAPVVRWLRDLGLYVDNEIQASAVAACFTVAIKTVDSGASFGALNTPTGAESTDANDDPFERIQPGLVTHLMPGEDVQAINPGRPNSAAEPWINLMLRAIAVGMGLSYELVSRDYSRTNYSSNRASALEDRRRFRPIQKFLIWRFCQPVYRQWFRQSVLAGDEGFPSPDEYGADENFWLRCVWRTPGWEWVDPVKEAQAAQLAVQCGFNSQSAIIAERGGDRDEVFEQIAEDKRIAEALDLTFATDNPEQLPEGADEEGRVPAAS